MGQTANHPFWQNWFLPATVVSLIGAAVSVFGAINAAQDKQREYNTSFTKILSEEVLRSQVFSKDPSVQDEQRAMASLLALQGLAQTESQRRTVLLVAGRLLNANISKDASGHPAARLLNVLIDQIDDDIVQGRDRGDNERLRRLTRARGFVDLAASGYISHYFSNEGGEQQPTLHGDVPISHSAKERLLLQIGPTVPNGWIHVGSWMTKYSFPNRGDRGRFAATRARVEARDVSGAAEEMVQYTDPALPPSAWVDRNSGPGKLILLQSRLLRENPPIMYVSLDGKNRLGRLGRVIGAVRAGSCINVLEPARPVLVTVKASRIGDRNKHKRRTGEDPALIHMWVHVAARASCEGKDTSAVPG